MPSNGRGYRMSVNGDGDEEAELSFPFAHSACRQTGSWWLGRVVYGECNCIVKSGRCAFSPIRIGSAAYAMATRFLTRIWVAMHTAVMLKTQMEGNKPVPFFASFTKSIQESSPDPPTRRIQLLFIIKRTIWNVNIISCSSPWSMAPGRAGACAGICVWALPLGRRGDILGCEGVKRVAWRRGDGGTECRL